MQTDTEDGIAKRQLMAQAIAFVMTAGASSLILTTDAKAALSPESADKAQKFLDEFGKQFLVELDKNGGFPSQRARKAPPWAHTLLDLLWGKLFAP